MSDLFFNAREAAQRQLGLDAAEPSPSFWDQAGYAGQRLWEGGVLRSGAMLAEGVMGPALEATGRTLQDRSIPFAGEDFNTGWKGFWDAVGDRAEAGMEEARAFRRTLDQADPGRVSDASELLYGLSNMFTLGATGAVAGGTLAGWAGAGAIGSTIAGGAGSAAVLGPSFGVAAYHDFVAEGVEADVARNAALIEGGSMAALGAMPVAVPGRLMTRVLSGAAINTAVGMPYRGAMETYLRSEGYEEQASRYRWNDTNAILADAVLGGVFGGLFGARRPMRATDVRDGGDEGSVELDIDPDAPRPPADAAFYFDEATELANHGDPAEAYAHALLARELGHPEANGLIEVLREDLDTDTIAEGEAIASVMAMREGLANPTPEQIAAAMDIQSETFARQTAPGVPLDSGAAGLHEASLSRAESQFAEGEEISVGDIWAGADSAARNFAPTPDETTARMIEVEWARSIVGGNSMPLRQFVLDNGGLRPGEAGAHELLGENALPIEEVAQAAWKEGLLPQFDAPPSAQEMLGALADERKQFGGARARQARDILTAYEAQGIDTSLQGEALRQALSTISREHSAEIAMSQVLDEAGFADLAKELEDARAQIRSMGGELGPDDLLFSMRTGDREGGPVRAEVWVAPEGVSLTERARKIVEMAVNGASNKWIAEEMDTSVETIRNVLAQAKKKLGGEAPWDEGRSGVAGGINPRTGEMTASIDEIIRLRDKLRASGFRNAPGRLSLARRSLNQTIATRLGLSADNVAARISQYEKAVREGRRAPVGEGDALYSMGRALPRRIIPAKTREGEAHQVYVNPTRDDLMRLTRIPAHGRAEPWKYDTVRFIRDADGNVFVANAYGFVHDDIAVALKREGILPPNYAFESGPDEGHGGWVVTGMLRRKGDALVSNEAGIDEGILFSRATSRVRSYDAEMPAGRPVNVLIQRQKLLAGPLEAISPTVDVIDWDGAIGEFRSTFAPLSNAERRIRANYALAAVRKVLDILAQDAREHAPLLYYFSPASASHAELYAGLAGRAQQAGYTMVGTPVGVFMVRTSKAKALEDVAYAQGLAAQVEAIRPSTVEALKARAAEELGADWGVLERAGFVEVIPDASALPFRIPEGVQALHLRHARKTYLLANAINPDNLRGLILHEIGVHHGMASMLGKRGWGEMLAQVDRMLADKHPAIAEARALAEAGSVKENVREETIAYLVEAHADLPLVQRILSRIRQWLIKTFGTTFGMRLTVDDIRALAVASLRRVAEQARRTAGDVTILDDVVLASKGPDAGRGGAGQFRVRPLSVNDMRGQEMFGYKEVTDASGRAVGAADVNILPDEVRIQNIVTRPEMRRQGIATQLVQDLMREFPGRRVTTSNMTDDGAAFFGARFSRNGDDSLSPLQRAPDGSALPADNAPNGGPADDFPLFSMGSQNRQNLVGAKRDPIENEAFQERLAAVRDTGRGDRANAGDVARRAARVPEQDAVGRGERQAGGVERLPSDAARADAGRADTAERDVRRQRIAEILSISGIHLTAKPKIVGQMGDYRLTIDTPFATEMDGLLQAKAGPDGPTWIDFDYIDGSNPKETRKPGVYLRLRRVHNDLKGMHVGRFMTRQLYDWAFRQGLPVYADYSISPEAQRLDASMKRLGYRYEKINDFLIDEDGHMVNMDALPIFVIDQGESLASPYDSAPPPRDDYQIDGPTLRERQQRVDEARERQQAYDDASPAEQALMDDPDILMSMGPARRRVNLPSPFIGAADVTMNPSKADMKRMLSQQHARDVQSLRWGITSEGDLVVWDGAAAMHAMVRQSLDTTFVRHGEMEHELEIDPVLAVAARARAGELGGYDPVAVAELLGVSVETATRMLARDGRLGRKETVSARTAMEAVALEQETARRVAQGAQAVAKCAARHGMAWGVLGSTTPAAGAAAALGRGLGLAAAIPAGIALAPAIATRARQDSDPEGYWRNEAALQNARAKYFGMRAGELEGLDDPSNVAAPEETQALSEVADPAGSIEAPEGLAPLPEPSENPSASLSSDYQTPPAPGVGIGGFAPPDAPAGAEGGEIDPTRDLIAAMNNLLNPEPEE